MNIFDVYIAFVSWGDGGKNRPVLILEHQGTVVSVFNITTQYEEKSDSVRSKYFKINDWEAAGLSKQSYVDTNTVWDLPPSAFKGKVEAGKLTENDVQRLLDFL